MLNVSVNHYTTTTTTTTTKYQDILAVLFVNNEQGQFMYIL